jgi:hypothetical protein
MHHLMIHPGVPSMRSYLTTPFAILVAGATLVFSAAPVAAQGASDRTVSVSAGVMTFDASGTGTAPTFALRVDRALAGRWLVGEAGLGYAPITEQFQTTRTRLGVAELQVQFQAPLPLVRPYVGVGAGVVAYLTNAGGRGRAAEAVSAAAGLRADLTPRVGLRLEGRLRYWDYNSPGFVNGSGEVTAGLSYRF